MEIMPGYFHSSTVSLSPNEFTDKNGWVGMFERQDAQEQHQYLVPTKPVSTLTSIHAEDTIIVLGSELVIELDSN